MEIKNIEEMIVMLKKHKVSKFQHGELSLEFNQAAFYDDSKVIPLEPEEEDEDEILYHSV
jgi:hypothetical protein